MPDKLDLDYKYLFLAEVDLASKRYENVISKMNEYVEQTPFDGVAFLIRGKACHGKGM